MSPKAMKNNNLIQYLSYISINNTPKHLQYILEAKKRNAVNF